MGIWHTCPRCVGQVGYKHTYAVGSCFLTRAHRLAWRYPYEIAEEPDWADWAALLISEQRLAAQNRDGVSHTGEVA